MTRRCSWGWIAKKTSQNRNRRLGVADKETDQPEQGTDADLALQLGAGELEDGDIAKGVEGVQEVQLKELRHAAPHAAGLSHTCPHPHR